MTAKIRCMLASRRDQSSSDWAAPAWLCHRAGSGTALSFLSPQAEEGASSRGLRRGRRVLKRGPSCLGLAYFTTISSFCAVERGERKKREIAFSSFLFLPFRWAFLTLTFLKCQELLVPIKCQGPRESSEREVLGLNERGERWARPVSCRGGAV